MRRLTIEDLALAYALRQEGVPWKLIAREFGFSESHLIRRVMKCVREGVGVSKTAAVKDSLTSDAEYTGGSVSYYTVAIETPTKTGRLPYEAECNDIIEALGMNYAEGNAFKAIWRRAAARQGRAKRGYTDGLYDAEKVQFFGGRLVAQELTKHDPEPAHG